jgi:cob(I)alamin adenosyltransferase
MKKEASKLQAAIRRLERSVVRAIQQAEVKQNYQLQYLHKKMSDYHRFTISWVVGTAIGTGSLIVALIKLL